MQHEIHLALTEMWNKYIVKPRRYCTHLCTDQLPVHCLIDGRGVVFTKLLSPGFYALKEICCNLELLSSVLEKWWCGGAWGVKLEQTKQMAAGEGQQGVNCRRVEIKPEREWRGWSASSLRHRQVNRRLSNWVLPRPWSLREGSASSLGGNHSLQTNGVWTLSAICKWTPFDIFPTCDAIQNVTASRGCRRWEPQVLPSDLSLLKF